MLQQSCRTQIRLRYLDRMFISVWFETFIVTNLKSQQSITSDVLSDHNKTENGMPIFQYLYMKYYGHGLARPNFAGLWCRLASFFCFGIVFRWFVVPQTSDTLVEGFNWDSHERKYYQRPLSRGSKQKGSLQTIAGVDAACLKICEGCGRAHVREGHASSKI